MLDTNSIHDLFSARRNQLESIKSRISPNFYNSTLDKINEEEQDFLRLLDLEVRKKKVLEEYSFILDPHFFDQKFIKH